MMRFVDEAVITVKSGDGGRGCVSFRREKYVPRGGPDGGDGGDGGSILLRATNKLHTLIDFNSRRFFKARNGEPGRGKNQSGKNGPDVVIEVPLGTILHDHDTGEVLADLVHQNQEILLLDGGKGGKGNQHFATPTNRAPRTAQPGLPGSETIISESSACRTPANPPFFPVSPWHAPGSITTPFRHSLPISAL